MPMFLISKQKSDFPMDFVEQQSESVRQAMPGGEQQVPFLILHHKGSHTALFLAVQLLYNLLSCKARLKKNEPTMINDYYYSSDPSSLRFQ